MHVVVVVQTEWQEVNYFKLLDTSSQKLDNASDQSSDHKSMLSREIVSSLSIASDINQEHGDIVMNRTEEEISEYSAQLTTDDDTCSNDDYTDEEGMLIDHFICTMKF